MDKITGINLKYINRLSDAEREEIETLYRKYENIIGIIGNPVNKLTTLFSLCFCGICLALLYWGCSSLITEGTFIPIVITLVLFFAIIICLEIFVEDALENPFAKVSEYIICHYKHIKRDDYIVAASEYEIIKTKLEIEEFLTQLAAPEFELVELATKEEGNKISVKWRFADTESGDVSEKEYEWYVRTSVENNKVDFFTLDVSNLKLLIPVNAHKEELPAGVLRRV